MLGKVWIAIGAVFIFSSVSFAAHPLITDDTGTQGKERMQIEINGEVSSDKSTEGGVTTKTEGRGIAAILSYGITDSADIIIGVPYQWSKTTLDDVVQSDESGIADMSLEAKWRFFEKDGFSLALKPGVTLPTGDENKGLGNGKASYSLTFIPMLESEPWMLHLNLAYTHNEYKLEADKDAKRNDVWHLSLAGGVDIAEGLTVVGNVGMETNEDKSSGKAPAFILGGIIYSVSENFDIDAGVKAGLNEPATDIAYLAGLAVRF